MAIGGGTFNAGGQVFGELLAVVVREDLGGSDQFGQIILQVQTAETGTVERPSHLFVQRHNLTFKPELVHGGRRLVSLAAQLHGRFPHWQSHFIVDSIDSIDSIHQLKRKCRCSAGGWGSGRVKHSKLNAAAIKLTKWFTTPINTEVINSRAGGVYRSKVKCHLICFLI